MGGYKKSKYSFMSIRFRLKKVLCFICFLMDLLINLEVRKIKNMVLNDLFDWQKTYTFITALGDAAQGQVKCTIHEKIADKIRGEISQPEQAVFNNLISADSGHNYNHHTHSHVQF